ncbi:Crp/Fnr family transcriptional regulator [Pedobacter sp. MC2016-05]|uniref:Crp/Fnr family transcriptional regulator n=1 Tax=Pedobacter sp. MC2016-05 TaxID=2994474 RepID=UPI002246CF9D|nr:Crp/Fnr family transcriptional regulator [Pedobacter sp. MC2016-05]MCX2474451.1 Crp/Fnr family transcriptional regulator [Pedobacter sp. MC2016-05]
MNSFEILFSHIDRKISLSPEEKHMVFEHFIPKQLAKKQYLLSEGEVCRNMAFVCSGLLKTFNVDEKGIERVSIFGWEGWWLSDFSSFLTGIKSVSFIDALEDAELLLISKENYEALTLQVPKMDRFFRILYQNSIVTKERRLRNSITYSASERYSEFIETNPEVSNRIPQHLIASYLGIAPETLSRIKRKIPAGK